MAQRGEFNARPNFTTTWRLMGRTHATPFLKRSVTATRSSNIDIATSTQPPFIPEDGTAAPNDSQESNDASYSDDHWVIEELVDKRVTKNGVTQYLVCWAGDWPNDQKYQWEPASHCAPADIKEFELNKVIKQAKRNDTVNGIPTHDEVINARGPRAHRTKRGQIGYKGQPASVVARQRRLDKLVSRRKQAETASTAHVETTIASTDPMNTTGNDGEEDEESDAEFELISAEEQAVYDAQDHMRGLK